MTSDSSHERKRSCLQCGTCCRKGGPALHNEDIHLVQGGKIPLNTLFTIRKGEPALDNIKQCIAPTPTDIIKIKPKPGQNTCLFLNEESNACTIYDMRPRECRTLQCWDTAEIIRVYDQNRLTRKDLLFETEALWDQVVDHQNRCDYERIRNLLDRKKTERPEKIEEEIRFLIRYDAHLRTLLTEKGEMDPDIMDFLFGRPLAVTVRRMELARAQGISLKNDVLNPLL